MCISNWFISIAYIYISFMTIFSPKLYIGESKIICTVGTCFAVDYTAGWA